MKGKAGDEADQVGVGSAEEWDAGVRQHPDKLRLEVGDKSVLTGGCLSHRFPISERLGIREPYLGPRHQLGAILYELDEVVDQLHRRADERARCFHALRE